MFSQELLSSPSSRYLIGWSHGKETLTAGSYDNLKGSYYVNCASFQQCDPRNISSSQPSQYHGYTGENIWPREGLLPGFRHTFEELSKLIIDVASLVARACDEYAVATVKGYEPGYLRNIVETSTTTKARLLHYYPQDKSTRSETPDEFPNSAQETRQVDVPNETDRDQDIWCASHVDHGCLTALISALYIDESIHAPEFFYPLDASTSRPPLPCFSAPPPSAGLYVQSRTSTTTKVTIPPDCLAFQTGEALQLITGGRFRAVPHFVRTGVGRRGERITRNTLAIFMQPELEEVIDRRTGLKFGELCQEVAERFK